MAGGDLECRERWSAGAPTRRALRVRPTFHHGNVVLVNGRLLARGGMLTRSRSPLVPWVLLFVRMLITQTLQSGCSCGRCCSGVNSWFCIFEVCKHELCDCEVPVQDELGLLVEFVHLGDDLLW